MTQEGVALHLLLLLMRGSSWHVIISDKLAQAVKHPTCVREVYGWNLCRVFTVLTEVVVVYSVPPGKCQDNILKIIPRTLPSTSFPIHCSLWSSHLMLCGLSYWRRPQTTETRIEERGYGIMPSIKGYGIFSNLKCRKRICYTRC
jgi:hypothetical protein